LDKKIKFTKLLREKKLLGDKTAFVMDHTNPGLTLENAKVRNTEFVVLVRGKNIYLFTQLIMQFLEGDKVSEVSITSADFEASRDEFTVGLRGVFR
jgi:hypothetical protein